MATALATAVTPFDFATIYDLLPLWNTTPTPINGTGETIAIVGRTDINKNDAPTFWSLFGLGVNGVPMPTLTITTNGPDPGFTGDEAEADIDTQWSGAAAPGATINFVTSESTETTDGVDLSAIYIVDNNLAPVMSESYGLCEAASSGFDLFYGAVWEQAAAQGISAMVSSGDNGAAGCDAASYFNASQFGLNVSGWHLHRGMLPSAARISTSTRSGQTTGIRPTIATTRESAKGYIRKSYLELLVYGCPGWNAQLRRNCRSGLQQPVSGNGWYEHRRCSVPSRLSDGRNRHGRPELTQTTMSVTFRTFPCSPATAS